VFTGPITLTPKSKSAVLFPLKPEAVPKIAPTVLKPLATTPKSDVHALMPIEQVLDMAENARSRGASRVCMGASWREVRDNRDFDRVLEMVTAVNEMGMEVCCTLGMLTAEQAQKLKDAGCFAYNHNIDTSEDY
jgi:biotin synthase-like enzyme